MFKKVINYDYKEKERGRGREEPDNECVYETKGKTNDS
jgi:hypothetical protein